MIRAIPGIYRSNFEDEYNAVLNRAVALNYTLPSSSQMVQQNLIIKALKDAGIWSQLDVFYNFWTDAGANFALLNWVSPSTKTIIRSGSPVFTSNKGFKSDGISGYLNLGFSLSQLTKYTLNNASKLIWAYDVSGVTTNKDHIDGNVSTDADTFYIINTQFQTMNSGVNTMNATFDMSGSGFKLMSRINSSTLSLYNGTTGSLIQGTRTLNSTTLTTANHQLLRRKTNLYAGAGVSVYALGANIDAFASPLFTILSNYLK